MPNLGFPARRLLTGPAGSGKSHALLALFREAWVAGDSARALFIVPTLSFQEHTRNSLLRLNPGAVLEGRGVVTFPELIRELVDAPPEFSAARREMMVERLLREMDHPYFRAVRDFPGFRETLADEADRALAGGNAGGNGGGIRPRGAPPRARAFLDFLTEYTRATAQFRRPAKTNAQAGLVLVDGFTDFTADQQRILEQLAARASHTVVTLPESCATARRTLVDGLGFVEERLTGDYRGRPTPVAVACDDRRAEVVFVARRILELVRQQGYRYRDIGIVVQEASAYLGAIGDIFRGLQIPARMFFPTVAADTSLGRHLIACLRLLRASQVAHTPVAHTEVQTAARLAVLKSPWGMSQSREWIARREFEAAAGRLSRLPLGTSLDWEPPATPKPGTPKNVAAMARAVLDTWERLTRFGETLPAADHARALELRADALTLRRAWELPGEIADAAQAEGVSMDFPAFLNAVERQLRQSRFRVRDRRVDAVNVMNAYEARQWELRAVFVIGAIEGEFPRPPRAPLFLPDTSAEQVREQEYLFDVATTRARDQLTITWPLADARGVALTPSRFVAHLVPEAAPRPRRAAILPSRVEALRLRLPASLETLKTREMTFTATGLRTFDDCAFKHFAQYRMRLQGRPRQERGLTSQLRGEIVHEAIMEWDRGHREESPDAVFARVFERKTRDLPGVETSHTAHKFRAAMRDDFLAFTASEPDRAKNYRTTIDPSYVEQDFRFPFTLLDGTVVELKGRVDRVEVSGGIGLAVDFKYSKAYTPGKLRDAMEEYQIAAYLMALQHWGLRPAGMEFQSLRDDFRRVGVLDASLTAEVYRGKPHKNTLTQVAADVIADGVARMTAAAAAIRAGQIDPAPRDSARCNPGRGGCDFYALCRVPRWKL